MLNPSSANASAFDSSLLAHQPEVSLLTAAASLGADATQGRALVFVDQRVDNYQQLVSNVNAEVILLDSSRNGLAQISEALAGREDVAALHILSHGSEGYLLLGQGSVDGDDLDAYAAEIRGWAAALDEEADILLYGCNVAGNAEGIAFVQRLGELSRADVAASNDLTGSVAFGGDWDLEVETGSIESDMPWSQLTALAYQDTLELPVIRGDTAETTTENTNAPINGDLDFTDADPGDPDDTWNVVTTTNTATGYGSFAINADGQWTYRLNESNGDIQALNSGSSLTDSFDATTSDGTLQTVTITINGANDAADLSGNAGINAIGTATENANATINGDLDFTDVDNPDDIWNAVTTATPTTNSYGTFTLQANGEWTYDLDDANLTVNALNASQTLTDSFTATTNDGTTQTVNITITGANDAPVMAIDAAATVFENEAGVDIANLTVADPDNGDNHSYSFTIDGLADNRFEVAGGKLKLKADEVLNHEKENNITLVVTATDNGNPQLSDTESINITVRDNLSKPDILVVDEYSDRDTRTNFRNLTLREAIGFAHSGDTIRFTTPDTIALTEGELLISDDITIDGDTDGDDKADITITRDSNSDDARLFSIQEGSTSTFNSLTLTNGQTGGFESGGAIFNAGTLTLNDSTLSNNDSDLGGGAIANTGTLTVTNSTFNSNNAGTSGGAIENSTGPEQDKPGIVNLNRSTFSGNSAINNGGGLSNARGTMTLTDSTITANTLTGNRSRFDGGEGIHSAGTLIITNSIVSGNGEDNSLNREIYLALGSASISHSLLGYDGNSGIAGVDILGNLSGFSLNGTNQVPGAGIGRDDVLNRTLADNGGTTQTHALVANSPAINAGSTSATTDQRGTARDANPDIGAFELPGAPATPAPPSLPGTPISPVPDLRPNRSIRRRLSRSSLTRRSSFRSIRRRLLR